MRPATRHFTFVGMIVLAWLGYSPTAWAVAIDVSVVSLGQPVPGAELVIDVPIRASVGKKRTKTVKPRAVRHRIVRRKSDGSGKIRIVMPRDLDCREPVTITVMVLQRAVRSVKLDKACRSRKVVLRIPPHADLDGGGGGDSD